MHRKRLKKLKTHLPLVGIAFALFHVSCENATVPNKSELPETPENLQAIAQSDTEVLISWTDKSDNEDGFIVELSETDQHHFTEHSRTSAGITSINIGGLRRATIYFARCASYNGYGRSSFSNNAMVTTQDIPPLAPTELRASLVDMLSVEVSWIDNSDNENGFRIERRVQGLSPWAIVHQVLPNTTSINIGNHMRGYTYLYRINAYNSFGESDYSNQVQIQIPERPLSPSNLRITNITDESISLRWDDNADNEDGFIVQRRQLFTDTTWIEIQRTGSRTFSYQDNNLISGRTYVYRVCAFNEAGVSDWSNEITGTTYTAPTTPAEFSAEILNTWQISLDWQDVTDQEADYEIQCSAGDSVNFTHLATIAAPASQFTTEDSVLFTDFYYRLRAVNDWGVSDWTDIVSANTPELVLYAGGLTVFDVSNPMNLKQVYRSSLNSIVNSLSITENLLYAGCTDELIILDLSDPMHPTIKSRFSATGGVDDLCLWEIYCGLVQQGNRFRILNVIDPENPREIGSLGFSARCLDADHDLVCLGTTDNRMKTIDVSNPEHPQQVGNLTLDNDIRNLVIQEDYVYQTGLNSGFQIVRISTPQNPAITAHLDISGRDLIVEGNFCFILSPNRLSIVNIESKTTPVVSGSIDLNGNAYSLCKWEGYLFIGFFDAKIQALDVSDPDNVLLLGETILEENCRSLDVKWFE